jgi:organic hydroperoxide reductase OsmC/OhrA
MNKREHTYRVNIEWTGNKGTGTSDYRSYGRDHTIRFASKPDISGSSDPAFRGDSQKWNPEELLVASLSACHKLSYLHLCAASGIAVQTYRDEAVGTMVEDGNGSAKFVRVLLRPHVTIRAHDDAELAKKLHHEAHAKCFIANSVNFPVENEPVIEVEPAK